MTNAKAEFLDHTEDVEVEAACITNYDDFMSSTGKKFVLNPGYSSVEFDEFCDKLDFEYDDGYGSQELYGTIWYIDGTWSTRSEYDGSEWWTRHTRPEIDLT